MKRILVFCSLITLLLFCSCKSKPSNDDIKKKVLAEMPCSENAKFTDFKVVKSGDEETAMGVTGIEYTVSGEVEWPEGCTFLGSQLPAGHKEKFDNKSVVFIKNEQDKKWY